MIVDWYRPFGYEVGLFLTGWVEPVGITVPPVPPVPALGGGLAPSLLKRPRPLVADVEAVLSIGVGLGTVAARADAVLAVSAVLATPALSADARLRAAALATTATHLGPDLHRRAQLDDDELIELLLLRRRGR